MGISPKVNVIARLEFEPADYHVAVMLISHYVPSMRRSSVNKYTFIYIILLRKCNPFQNILIKLL